MWIICSLVCLLTLYFLLCGHQLTFPSSRGSSCAALRAVGMLALIFLTEVWTSIELQVGVGHHRVKGACTMHTVREEYSVGVAEPPCGYRGSAVSMSQDEAEFTNWRQAPAKKLPQWSVFSENFWDTEDKFSPRDASQCLPCASLSLAQRAVAEQNSATWGDGGWWTVEVLQRAGKASPESFGGCQS